MALVNNLRNAASYARGTIVGGAEAWSGPRYNSFVNIYASEASVNDKSGVPDGYNTGGIVLPLKPGGMRATSSSALAQDTIVLIMGMPISGTSSIQLTVVSAALDATFPMQASGSIVVAVDSAALAAAVNASATGSITLSVDSAVLGGIFEMDATGTIVVTPDVVLTALAWIEAEAGGPTPLSPEGLANAVWQAASADQNDPGTMGELLNDAGAAGNPWAADTASNNTPGTFGALVQSLLTVAKFLGLK